MSWYNNTAPEETETPDSLDAAMDHFRKLLLVRCWCPDRIAVQAKKYIEESLGRAYADGVILDMKVSTHTHARTRAHSEASYFTHCKIPYAYCLAHL